MKKLLLSSLLLATSLNTTIASEYAHCTFKDQSADDFFHALIVARKKLEYKNLGYDFELEAPSFTFNKRIKLDSWESIDNPGTYKSKQVTDSIQKGKCFVELRVYNPNNKRKSKGFAKGFTRSFDSTNEKFEVFKRSYNMYGNTELFIVDNVVGIEIVASEACKASEIVSSLATLGLKANFISKQKDTSCYPQ